MPASERNTQTVLTLSTTSITNTALLTFILLTKEELSPPGNSCILRPVYRQGGANTLICHGNGRCEDAKWRHEGRRRRRLGDKAQHVRACGGATANGKSFKTNSRPTWLQGYSFKTTNKRKWTCRVFILAQIHPTCNEGARSPHLWSSDVGSAPWRVHSPSCKWWEISLHCWNHESGQGKKNKTQTGILGGLNRSLACCDSQSECIMWTNLTSWQKQELVQPQYARFIFTYITMMSWTWCGIYCTDNHWCTNVGRCWFLLFVLNHNSGCNTPNSPKDKDNNCSCAYISHRPYASLFCFHSLFVLPPGGQITGLQVRISIRVSQRYELKNKDKAEALVGSCHII